MAQRAVSLLSAILPSDSANTLGDENLHSICFALLQQLQLRFKFLAYIV